MLLFQFKKSIRKFLPKRYRLSQRLFDAVYIKKKGIEEKANSIQTIALGSSHCEHGFDAGLIKNAFNLGIIDQDLYSSHKILDKYIEKLNNLKNVILFYSIHSQGYELSKTNSKKYAALMHYVFDIPYEGDFLKQYYKSASRRLKNFDDSQIDYKTFWGYMPEKKNPNITPPNADFRCTHHLRENRRPFKQNHHVFEMEEICRKRGINFSIVIPPYRSDFLDELKKYNFPDEELFYEVFHWTKENNVPILNELHSMDYEWDDFYDCDHLDVSGAKKLTKKIAKFINVPLK